jgi:hypothetical protein
MWHVCSRNKVSPVCVCGGGGGAPLLKCFASHWEGGAFLNARTYVKRGASLGGKGGGC